MIIKATVSPRPSAARLCRRPFSPAAIAAPPAPSGASACFKFRVHNLELLYTLCGVDDAEIQGRITDTLPMLQDMMEACEDRHAARQAEREAAKAAQAQEPPPSTPAELQQLVQQAVQQALAAQASG